MTKLKYFGVLGSVVALFGVGLVCFAEGRFFVAVAIALLAMGVVAFMLIQFKCTSCGRRPGKKILFIWWLALGPELFISDAVFLKRCPYCQRHPFAPPI